MSGGARESLFGDAEPAPGADLDIPTLTEPSAETGERQAAAHGGEMTSRVGNPFAAASDDFFPSGQRKRLFDQLRHLSQWSRRALLVTGVLGSGKTTLHTHLARALGKDASAAAVCGGDISNQRALFVQLHAQLGIDHASDASSELLSDLLRGFVQTQNELERLCVILVDDAQEMDTAAMEALLKLSADCRVRLIFFGEATLTKLVDKATVNLEIACHETPLLALSAADTRAYIEWRTKQLGYTQMPFNEEQLASLFNASDGVPGRIDVLASQMLEEMALTGSTGTAAQPTLLAMRKFPLSNLLIALGLALVLGLLYYLLDAPEPAPQELVTPVVPAPSVADQAAIEARRAEAAQVESAAAERVAAESAAAERIAAESAAAERVAVEQIAAERAAAEKQAADKAAAEAAAAEKAAAEQRAAAEAEAAAADARAQAEARARAEAEAEVVRQRTGETLVPGVKGSDWLLQQDGGHYTIQLVTLGSREGMIQYLRGHAAPERFALYTRNAGNQTMYVATFGSYASRAQAEAASRALPASVGQVKPWIRPMREVQQTIRAASR